MTGQQLERFQHRDSEIEPYQPDAAASRGDSADDEGKGPNIARYWSAITRFKWLILAITLLGAGAGYGATKFIASEYEVGAVVLLESGTGTNADGRRDRGPIQAAELLGGSGWQDLLRSPGIVDPVVTKLGLFIQPRNAADSVVFRGFRADQQRLRPGDYVLTVKAAKYSLALKAGVNVESGTVGDSVGRAVGFQWQPSAQDLTNGKTIEFNVLTPREASQNLIKKLGVRFENGSSLMFLSLTGEDARLTAATLNEWTEQFVAIATRLKKQNISFQAAILEGQQKYAADQLSAAENALEGFRVRTVTQPTERQTLQPGIEMTNSPVFENYFRDRVVADNYARDRASLERLLAAYKSGSPITREAVLSIPAVNSDPAAENLRNSLAEQATQEVALRRLREKYTDEYIDVKNAQAALETLRRNTVPASLESYVGELRLRESALTAKIGESGKELRGIPSRAIEEQRLKRNVEVSTELYRNLNLKTAEAKLAEASTIPDVRVLDAAVAPLRPTRNTAPVIILGAIGAALGLGIVLAILLDQLDKRFRYPEQATDELGLFVLGVVPVVQMNSKRRQAEQAAHVVEAFRTIRMNVRYAADPARPLTLTVTSPGPNDGKSLISANLALSFAEAGARTLLIDGDIRRGELAKTFGIPSRPGLVEYLDGTALIAEVLHPVAAHPNMVLLPGGARRRRAPELLATPRLTQLINQMAAEYDVVIVDSPPLGAGFDAYALATATVNMALVMRAGITDRKMAAAKMSVVGTLPVRVLGAVLNGIELKGVYQYYSYYQDYAAHDEEEPTPRIEGARSRSENALPGSRS